jgi:hypothetical protein
VIGFTGDGGSMYTIQALWTAARYHIGAKFVICNNQSYMLLKENILQYWRDQVGAPVHKFPTSFDLDNPVVDFAALSRSMIVPKTLRQPSSRCSKRTAPSWSIWSSATECQACRCRAAATLLALWAQVPSIPWRVLHHADAQCKVGETK